MSARKENAHLKKEISIVRRELILELVNNLFVKVLRPGDSEETFAVFESSCHLLLPV